jgi:hypothetical protein
MMLKGPFVWDYVSVNLPDASRSNAGQKTVGQDPTDGNKGVTVVMRRTTSFAAILAQTTF